MMKMGYSDVPFSKRSPKKVLVLPSYVGYEAANVESIEDELS